MSDPCSHSSGLNVLICYNFVWKLSNQFQLSLEISTFNVRTLEAALSHWRGINPRKLMLAMGIGTFINRVWLF